MPKCKFKKAQLAIELAMHKHGYRIVERDSAKTVYVKVK